MLTHHRPHSVCADEHLNWIGFKLRRWIVRFNGLKISLSAKIVCPSLKSMQLFQRNTTTWTDLANSFHSNAIFLYIFGTDRLDLWSTKFSCVYSWTTVCVCYAQVRSIFVTEQKKLLFAILSRTIEYLPNGERKNLSSNEAKRHTFIEVYYVLFLMFFFSLFLLWSASCTRWSNTSKWICFWFGCVAKAPTEKYQK